MILIYICLTICRTNDKNVWYENKSVKLCFKSCIWKVILLIPNNELESRSASCHPYFYVCLSCHRCFRILGKIFINVANLRVFFFLAYRRSVVCFHPLICNSTQEYDTRFRKLSTTFCSGCLCIQGTTITELKSQAQAFLVRIVGLNVVVELLFE